MYSGSISRVKNICSHSLPPVHSPPTHAEKKKILAGEKQAGNHYDHVRTRSSAPHWGSVSYVYIYIKSLTNADYPKRPPDHWKGWSFLIYRSLKGAIMIYVNHEFARVREN